MKQKERREKDAFSSPFDASSHGIKALHKVASVVHTNSNSVEASPAVTLKHRYGSKDQLPVRITRRHVF